MCQPHRYQNAVVIHKVKDSASSCLRQDLESFYESGKWIKLFGQSADV